MSADAITPLTEDERVIRSERLWSDLRTIETLVGNLRRNLTVLVGPEPPVDTDTLGVHPMLRGY